MRIEEKKIPIGIVMTMYIFDIYLEEGDGLDAYAALRKVKEQFPGEEIAIAGKGHMRVTRHVQNKEILHTPERWKNEGKKKAKK